MPKRTGYIKEKITHELVVKAINRAKRGKTKRRDVRRFLGWDEGTKTFTKIHQAADLILDTLVNETWEPFSISERTIKDGSSGKERLIGRVPFFDQVIHWVLVMAIRPAISRGYYHHSVACVDGRGAHRGRQAVARWLERDRKNTKYYLVLDVQKFYPSVTADVATELLKRVIKDPWFFRTFEKYTATWVHGMPIGHLFSQHLASFILTPTDHFIKEQLHIPYYLRYMDDMRLYGPSKRALHKARAAISEYLSQFGLALKGNWQVRRQDKEPNDVMGFIFKRGATILRKKIMLRMSQKVRRVAKRNTWNPHNCMSILSYLGWLKYTDCYGFFIKWIDPYLIGMQRMKGVVRRADFRHRYAA